MSVTCQKNEPESAREKEKRTGRDNRRESRGQVREKRGDIRIDTLRQTYGDSFARGIRGDAHLKTLLDRTGSTSLSDYLKLVDIRRLAERPERTA